MKLSEIKTELFTRTSITDFGVRFESFDKDKWEEMKHRYHYMSYFVNTISLQLDGSIITDSVLNKKISFEQLQEIARVSEVLRGEGI